MATLAKPIVPREPGPDRLSGTPRAHALDRWIYVITAASFIVIVLAGFIPSSLQKIAAVQAGARPPFPLVMHVHALLMGSFLLLLLTQTILVASGRRAQHRRLGIAALAVALAMVAAGLLLVPTNYHALQAAAQAASAATAETLRERLLVLDNILLLQLQVGILFPLLLVVGAQARDRDPGLHKRMMILATAMALPAGINRIPWLPTTMPISPLSSDLYILAAISPMLAWDVVRNQRLHRAYWIWLGAWLPLAMAAHLLWGSEFWHMTAQRILSA